MATGKAYILKPNDSYLLSSPKFSLNYVFESNVSQQFDIWVEDSFVGIENQLPVQFN
ncbi:hypothetical protein CHA01nite_08950 [Chryseobacterium hagamense]|uniref:Uncharacterized protein n=2 Tax=Chryseobacterium hagamense TaxID=395935 RepID=A0A511YIX7_9FLAO|nr:hypothetical protein CHA01nite_08950 [Chryseobacterium hagamense]